MGMHLLTLVALHPCSSLGGGGGGGGGRATEAAELVSKVAVVVVMAAAGREERRMQWRPQVATALASFQWIKIIRFNPGRRVANDLGGEGCASGEDIQGPATSLTPEAPLLFFRF